MHDHFNVFLEIEKVTAFDELLEAVEKELLIPEATINTNKTFLKESKALGQTQDEVDLESVINRNNQLKENMKQSELSIKERFENLLDEVTEDEVTELVKKTKYISRRKISGNTFMLRETNGVSNRIKEETVEKLINLSPDKVYEKIDKNSKSNIVEKFIEIHRPKNVSGPIEKWIEENISDQQDRNYCKTHYEEMKEMFFTKDTIQMIATRWVSMARGEDSRTDVSKEEMEKIKESCKTLLELFKKELTII